MTLRHLHYLALITFCIFFFSAAPAGAQTTATPAPRIPWTTSRVVGSPEPPPPYQLDRAYPKLTFSHPIDLGFAPGSNLRFLAEQSGKIHSFADNEAADKTDIFFDAHQIPNLDKIPNCRGIDSVFGFTFHPQFQQNHYVFICYMLAWKNANGDKPHGLRVSRFTVNPGGPGDPPSVDMASEKMLLSYWGAGHSSGCLKFGPDGLLYIGTGDGADPTPPDPFNTGQDVSDLLASILRIDVDHDDPGLPYAVPKDNPFVKTAGARPEIWAYGFRNPWRFSFDRATGDLWAGDVGWETWEMVYRVQRGGNYGWSVSEGPGPVHPDDKRGPTPILPPTLYYNHAEGASVTGGFVYRGKRFPELVGQYIFGDWETRRLWAAPLVEKGLGKHKVIAQSDQRIVSFGEDAAGELYIVDYEAGGLYRIAPQPPESTNQAFPRRLSETGLFASVEKHTPAPGVVPFSPRAEQWVDGSTSQRWVGLPGGQTVGADKEGKRIYPAGTVLTRTLSMPPLPAEANPPVEAARRIETQLLHFDGKRWNGYSYRWNDQQTDASLVDAAGEDVTLKVGATERSWHFPSRAQCIVCHNSWAGFTLAFNPAQLAPSEPALALFTVSSKPPKPLVDPHDSAADLTARARSYLHANCAHCHRFGGGGSANIDLAFETDDAKSRAFGTVPTQGAFGIADARVIAPGSPSQSLLFYRMAKLGSGHMPHMGSTEIDPKGLELIRTWIASLPAGDAAAANSIDKDRAAVEQLRQVKSGAMPAALERVLISTTGAMELASALDAGKFDAAARQQIVTLAYASDKDEIRGLFGRFVTPAQRIKTLGASIKPRDVLGLDGDAQRGRQVFAEMSGGLCARCHQVGAQGQSFGPELTHIGGKYDRVQLLENIIEPSKAITQGFGTTRVKLKKGDPQAGLIIARTDAEIVLRTGPGMDVHIATADVDQVVVDPASLMPEGLLGGLTAQQAADLLEYLQSLK